MSNETPFTAHGDETVEARIVSWVLGEASAFEVAELERLCEERPELMVFKRRMAALHGLITEAEKPRFNHAWKLPAGKRRPLDEIIGEEPPVRVDFEKEKRIRHSGRRAFLAIAACLILTVVVAGLMAPMALKQSRKSDVAEARSMARQREMAAMEDQERGGVAYQAMESLSTVLPPERIEGTPNPMVLPGQKPSKEKAQRQAPAASYHMEVDAMAASKKVETQSASKPSAPTSSMAKAITSNTASPTAIPTPDVDVSTPSLDFGDGKDFGTGWGGGEGSGGGIANAPADGLRSSTGTIAAGSASVLADSREGGLKKDLATLENNKKSATGYWTADESAKAEMRANNLPAPRGMIVDGREVAEKDSGGRGPTPSATPAAGPAPENPAGPESYSELAKREMIRRGNKAGEGDRDIAYLEDPLRTNPALTYEYQHKVDEVRKDLYKAEGNYNLGKYDDAKREYEEVLRKDPYNTAARKGMEQIASAKSDYYRAAYDHTRAELLSQVDAAWEIEVPADGDKSDMKEFDGFVNYGSPIANAQIDGGIVLPKFSESPDTEGGQSKENANGDPFWDTSKDAESGKSKSEVAHELHTGYTSEYLFRGKDLGTPEQESKSVTGLAAREMTRRQSTVVESDRLLADARSAYATGDYQKAYGNYEKALNLLPDVPVLEERRDFLRKSLGDTSVALSLAETKEGRSEESKQWLNKAREWDPSNAKARQQLIADVTSEIAASEDPYSTFSLNISDASFQIAQAALAKGERPDPAGIKVEQFYNAVNYGDPAPAANQPVSCVIEQAAHPVIPGRNLVRVALKTAAAGRSAAQPLRLTLLVDQSGSMSRADRRAAMDTAMRSLGTLLTDKDLVTVIGFSRKSRLLAVDMKGNELGAKLADIVNQSASEGGTNLEDAIKLAEEKAMRQKLVGAQNRIVLFTDGAANLGDADPQRLAAKVEQLRQQGIAFDIAGIAADDLNDELLAELARKGNGRYSVVGKGGDENFAKQLAGAFRPAAENVKVQVRFNPERVARYKLIGFEKDRLKTEDFRNDTVDAAELAAEEAGVAIYQVEPLAEGRGEIGEVSVRFRDTATGEMVERMWTMTHDPATPAADRATPSMQLAVLSMLAGEKLKGGPLADAIDFKNLVQAQATVKQAFGQDTRVSDMLRMVDALK